MYFRLLIVVECQIQQISSCLVLSYFSGVVTMCPAIIISCTYAGFSRCDGKFQKIDNKFRIVKLSTHTKKSFAVSPPMRKKIRSTMSTDHHDQAAEIIVNKALIWKFMCDISQTLSKWVKIMPHTSQLKRRKKFTVNKEIHSLTPTSAYIFRAAACTCYFSYWLSVRVEKKNALRLVIHTTCRLSRSNVFFANFILKIIVR